MIQISASILSANFLRLEEEIEELNQSEVDFIHIDVMDGLFVPNISLGFPVIDAIANVAKKPLDIHLMIYKPERYIEKFLEYKPAFISIHYEGQDHLHRVIELIKKNGTKAGVVINPHTPVSVLESTLCDADMVLVMSVNPGFGGQQFIPHSLTKVKQLRNLIDDLKTSTLIEVDGGISKENVSLLVQHGADILVIGNALFTQKNKAQYIQAIKTLVST
ncbi:MAG: ribulose-phosphate 3-epimerase [Bacteroidales bacterium]|nr:ribulose-phosphate 3-epimerase [Bacteroidales bacterium]